MSYIRQNFEDKETILSAKHLQNIEDGIIEAINIASNMSYDEISIPEYWKTHIDEKILEINALNETWGGDADNFVFLTDMHLPGNSGNSFPLIRYIMDKTSVKKLFISGDIIEGNQGNETDTMLLRDFSKSWGDMKVFPTRGNHDAHESDITDAQWYDTITRKISNYATVSDKLYYYYDNSSQKIRYIFADCIWGYGKYAAQSYLISDEQLAWIKERVLELESDWTVLIVKHHLWSISSEGILNDEGKKIVNYLETFYDEAKCSIVGIFAGHSHSDHVVNADKGYILVSTIGDAKQVSGWKSGTINEQAFDVTTINTKTGEIKTTRIGGRGQNREFQYAVNGNLPLKGISLNYDSLIIGPSNTRTLTASLEPNNATNKNVNWEITSGEQYVSITPSGLSCEVTGLGFGSAVVKVSSEDKQYSAICNITIKEVIIEDITNEFQFTEGLMVYANNGGEAAHSGWIASDYVDISKYSVIKIKMSKTSSTGTNTGLALYDKDKKYVTGIAHTDGVATYGTMVKEIDIPQNVVYVRTTYWSKNHASYKDEFGEFYCEGII